MNLQTVQSLTNIRRANVYDLPNNETIIMFLSIKKSSISNTNK